MTKTWLKQPKRFYSALFDSILIRRNVTVAVFAKIVIGVCRSYYLFVHQHGDSFQASFIFSILEKETLSMLVVES